MGYPGKGFLLQRLVAVLIVFLPLTVVSWALSQHQAGLSTSSGPYVSVAVYMGALLLASFTYDALKAILLTEQGRFARLWAALRAAGFAIVIYLACIVILALLPSPLGFFDAFIAVISAAAMLIAYVAAIRSFLAAVESVVGD